MARRGALIRRKGLWTTKCSRTRRPYWETYNAITYLEPFDARNAAARVMMFSPPVRRAARSRERTIRERLRCYWGEGQARGRNKRECPGGCSDVYSLLPPHGDPGHTRQKTLIPCWLCFMRHSALMILYKRFSAELDDLEVRNLMTALRSRRTPCFPRAAVTGLNIPRRLDTQAKSRDSRLWSKVWKRRHSESFWRGMAVPLTQAF